MVISNYIILEKAEKESNEMVEKGTINKRCGQLVDAYKNGDISAAEELYNLTVKKSYLIAASVTDIRQDTEDIVQESYMYAFKNIMQLQDNTKFQSWLNVIVANKAKDFLGKNIKQQMISMDSEGADLWMEDRIAENDVNYEVYQNGDDEKSRIIWEMICNLPKEMRLCVTMYYYDEMSVSEIAQALNIAEGTVKSRLYNARKHIKEQVEETEKKGIKLYSANVPFAVLIIYAFLKEEKNLKGLELNNLAVVLGESAAENAAAGGAVVKNVGKTAGKTLPIGVKIGIGLSVAAAVAVLAAGVIFMTGNKDDRHDNTKSDINHNYTMENNEQDDISEENNKDNKETPVMAKEQLKGLKAEVVYDDIISRLGISTDEDTYAFFLTKNIFVINSYKNQVYQNGGCLCTTEGKKIETGDFAAVKSAEVTYELQSSENLFAISYDENGVEGNTYGLMDINGKLLIPEEYYSFKILSPDFVVAMRLVEINNLDAPTMAEYDVYNLKTGKKIENLTGLHSENPAWDKFYAGNHVIFRQYYVNDEERQMIVDEDGTILFSNEEQGERKYLPVCALDYDESHELYFLSQHPNADSQMEIRNDKFEVILSEDEEIILPGDGEYYEESTGYVYGIVSENVFIVKQSLDDDWYLYDHKKKKVISEAYGELKPLGNGYIEAIEKDTEKAGLITKDGKVVINCMYDSIPVCFDYYYDDYLWEYKLDAGLRKQLELGVFEARYNGELVYVNLKGEFVQKDFGELAESEIITGLYERYGRQLMMKYNVNTDGEEDIYKGKEVTIFAPGGTKNVDSKNLLSIEDGMFIFTERKELENQRYEYTVYDYMLEPILQYDSNDRGRFYMNEDLSYAVVKTNDELILYKISQK